MSGGFGGQRVCQKERRIDDLDVDVLGVERFDTGVEVRQLLAIEAVQVPPLDQRAVPGGLSVDAGRGAEIVAAQTRPPREDLLADHPVVQPSRTHDGRPPVPERRVQVLVVKRRGALVHMTVCINDSHSRTHCRFRAFKSRRAGDVGLPTRAKCALRLLNLVMYMVYNQNMIRINIADAKANLSRYLASVEDGETILVCRRNIPVAEIRPVTKPPAGPRPVGFDRGMTLPSTFFEPLPEDLLDAVRGKTREPVKLLLDTCTFLWLAADAPELSPVARQSCIDPGKGLPERPVSMGNHHQTPTRPSPATRSPRIATWPAGDNG